MTYVSIPIEQYAELLRDQEKLMALENYGVDCWDGYEEAMSEIETEVVVE